MVRMVRETTNVEVAEEEEEDAEAPMRTMQKRVSETSWRRSKKTLEGY